MPFVGLVSDPRWEPPEGGGSDPDGERGNPLRRVPWSIVLFVIWLGVWVGLMALVPIVAHAFGGLAGYLLLCFNVGIGFWRFDRWCSRQYWRGLRDYQA